MAEQMSLSGAVPSRSNGLRECPQCHSLFEPYNRAESRQVYCSDDCRHWHWEEEHGKPRPVQNPDKMTRAEKILARLRQGPATGLDLLKAGGGMRYGARILELRQAGYQIETDMPRDTGLEWPMYRLEQP